MQAVLTQRLLDAGPPEPALFGLADSFSADSVGSTFGSISLVSSSILTDVSIEVISRSDDCQLKGSMLIRAPRSSVFLEGPVQWNQGIGDGSLGQKVTVTDSALPRSVPESN